MHAIDFRAWGAAGTGASDPIWMIYRCPNIRTQEANGADKDCAAPTSAAGLQQGTLALEQAMDELACQLQMDPLEFRCKNFADHPFLPLEKMCQLGAGGIGWDARRRGNTAGAATVRRGVGMAVSAWPSAGVSFAQAMVRIYPDGRVEVVTGAQDLGTGTGTALGMIAAEELGVPLEKVKISLGDTACGLAAPPSRRPICSCARRLPRPAGSTGIDAPGKACGHKGSCLRHRCATRQFRQARSTARDIRLDSDWRQGIVRDEGWAMNLSWRGKGWRKPHDSVCAMRRSVCRARERLRFSDRFAGLAYELSNGYGAPPRVAEGPGSAPGSPMFHGRAWSCGFTKSRIRAVISCGLRGGGRLRKGMPNTGSCLPGRISSQSVGYSIGMVLSFGLFIVSLVFFFFRLTGHG